MFNIKLALIAAAAAFVISLGIGLVSGAGLFSLVRALVFAFFFFVLAGLVHVAAGKFLPELLEIARSGPEESGPGARVNISLDGDVAAGSAQAGNGQTGNGQGGNGLAGNGLAGNGHSGLTADVERSWASPGDSGSFDDDGQPALDQSGEDQYNGNGGVADGGGGFSGLSPGTPEPGFSGAPSGSPEGGTPSPGGNRAALPETAPDADSVDSLPDLEAMSQAFLASTQEAEQNGETGGGSPFPAGGTRDDVFSVSLSGRSREPASWEGNKSTGLEGDFQPKDIAQAIQTLLKRDQG